MTVFFQVGFYFTISDIYEFRDYCYPGPLNRSYTNGDLGHDRR